MYGHILNLVFKEGLEWVNYIKIS